MRQPVRTREVVLGELSKASTRRQQAARAANFDAYDTESKKIDALLEELRPLLPAQRVSDAPS